AMIIAVLLLERSVSLGFSRRREGRGPGDLKRSREIVKSFGIAAQLLGDRHFMKNRQAKLIGSDGLSGVGLKEFLQLLFGTLIVLLHAGDIGHNQVHLHFSLGARFRPGIGGDASGLVGVIKIFLEAD